MSEDLLIRNQEQSTLNFNPGSSAVSKTTRQYGYSASSPNNVLPKKVKRRALLLHSWAQEVRLLAPQSAPDVHQPEGLRLL